MFHITTYPKGALTGFDETKFSLRDYKANQGKNCITGESENFTSLKELTERASQVPISPSLLQNSKRLANNFLQTRLIIMDVDDVFTIEDVQNRLNKSGFCYSIYTSFSHSKEKNKFHIILPIDRTITTVEEYKATYVYASELLFNNKNDSATCSPANLFFNSNKKTKEIYVEETELFFPKQQKAQQSMSRPATTAPKPQIANKSLSKRTEKFLLYGANNGEWHKEFILAAKNLKAAGYNKQEVIERMERVTGELTQEDIYQIDKAFQDSIFEYDTALVKSIHPLCVKYMSSSGKIGRIPTSEIVEAYIKDKILVFGLNKQFFLDGENIPGNIVIENIRDFADRELNQLISPTNIGSVLENIHHDSQKARFKELQNYVEFDNSNFDFLNLSRIITGEENELISIVIKHFIWQVKRKMWDKEVDYHMMPVLVGDSGSGKSKLINKMLEPIKDVCYLDGDFKKLVDTRESHNLIDNYVYFADEMGKAQYADVDTIKNKITSRNIQYRRLGTNTTLSGRNNATFIGASNENIEYIIKDETSVRRFFQINTLSRMMWDEVNELDYLKMWKSIDEKNNEPILKAHLDKIVEAQKNFKYKSVVEYFINEELEGINNVGTGDKVSQSELYVKFKDYRILSGYTTNMGKHLFYEKLRRIVGSPQRGAVNGSYVNYYCLPKKDNSVQ